MSWEPVVYRDIWADDLRLIIDGRDVTYFRDVPVQFGGYQLQQPFGYGPANFRFPQVTGLEHKTTNTRPLAWLREGATARLVPVTSGTRGDDVWRGVVTRLAVEDGTVEVHCDGEASGRLSLRDRQPAMFWLEKDLGLFIWEAFHHCRIPMAPRLGTETGIVAENRGGGTDYLQWVNGLLAQGINADLDQWTVDPVTINGRHTYKVRLKDVTTVDATIFYGAEGVKESLSSDIQEKPNTWFGVGIEPDGLKWNNAVAPGIVQGEAPPYPFTDGRAFGVGTHNDDTDTGDGISVMHSRLISRYMDRDDASATYDAETAEAVEALQEDAGLPQTGSMTTATWDALFDLSVTGLNIYQARILPLAEKPEVRKWNLTASGALAERNPEFDADVVPVDITIDHGPGSKQAEARKWSRRQMRRATNGKVWTGTIELTADVLEGNVHHTDGTVTPMSRLDLRPGMNIMLRHFDDGVLFHISGVNVDADKTVRLAVDSKARDLQQVAEIIARNKETRRDPRREFMQSVRGRSFDSTIIWNKLGGKVDTEIPLTGDTWNVFEVAAGQSGILEWLQLQLDPACEFVMGIAAQLIHAGALNRDVGNPFVLDADGVDVSEWAKPSVQRMLKREQFMIYTAGTVEQPCGYSPGQKYGRRVDADGNPVRTDDPLTGEHEDDAGIQFHTFAHPVLYVCVYPDRDTVVQPGRVMKLLHTEGV